MKYKNNDTGMIAEVIGSDQQTIFYKLPNRTEPMSMSRVRFEERYTLDRDNDSERHRLIVNSIILDLLVADEITPCQAQTIRSKIGTVNYFDTCTQEEINGITELFKYAER